MEVTAKSNAGSHQFIPALQMEDNLGLDHCDRITEGIKGEEIHCRIDAIRPSHYSLEQFARTKKGASRLCLVTDSNRAMSMPAGDYRFGPQEDGTRIKSDGEVGFIPGEGLASSVVGMDAMVRTMAHQTSASLLDVIRMPR